MIKENALLFDSYTLHDALDRIFTLLIIKMTRSVNN